MFSKSQRFADRNAATPGPGEYDPKLAKSVPLAAFPKEQRFSDSSDTESLGPGAYCQPVIGRTKKSEFKIPPSKQRGKKNPQQKTVSAQTDITGNISSRLSDNGRSEEADNELRYECSQLQSQLNDLQTSFDEAREKSLLHINCLEVKVAQLQSLLDDECCRVSLLSDQLRDVTAIADNATKDKMAATQEVTRLNDALEKAVQAKQLCTEELQDSLDKLKDQVQKVAEVQAELDRLRAEQEERCKKLTDELTLEIESLKKSLCSQEETIASLTSSLSRETELRLATEASSDNKSQTISCLKHTVEELKADICQWERLHNNREERHGQLEQQMTCTSSSVLSLTDQLEALKIANEQSRVDYELLQCTNQKSTSKMLSLERIVASKETEIQELRENLCHARKYQQLVREKEAKIEQLLDTNNLLSAKLDDYKQLRAKMDSMAELVSGMESKHKEELLSHGSMLAEARIDREKVEEQNKVLERELDQEKSSAEELKQQYADRVVSLQTKVCDVEEQLHRKEKEAEEVILKFEEEKNSIRDEMASVQELYNDLQKKVAPFKEQLDAYELEMNALSGQSKNWATEAAKAAQEYAKLLGHQNQKQKIKRINQISEENFTLKQEVMNLRGSEAKLKRQLSQAQDRLRSAEGKKRFDASKAFQRDDVENGGKRSPLKCFNSDNH